MRDTGMPESGSKVIVCVSGGADSVALLDVMMRSGYHCIVAHCNFHLRGEESNRDEQFVKALVAQRSQVMNIPVESRYVDFDTFSYAREHTQSIEMAARELRYRWFAEIAAQEGCSAIAVAHHQNDQAETVLMHIRRGCGPKGLCGMRPISPNPCVQSDIPIIRPLLCTTHDYICHYLSDIRHIEWMEDSTNSDTRFKRNAIREELSHWTKAEIEHVAKLAEIMQHEHEAIRTNR